MGQKEKYKKSFYTLVESLRADCTLDVSLAEIYRGAEKTLVDWTARTWVVGTLGYPVERREPPYREPVVIDLGSLQPEYFTNPTRDPVLLYGLGHEMWTNGYVIFGNMYVHVRVLDDPIYRMDNIGYPNNLHAALNVSIADYFYGRSFELPHPSGLNDAPPVFVEYEGGQTVSVFNGSGMRCLGTLYVHFDLIIPSTREERDALLDEIVSFYSRRNRMGVPASRPILTG
jgi:hypothetical protein